MLQSGKKVKLKVGNIIVFDKIHKTIYIHSQLDNRILWDNGDNKFMFAGNFSTFLRSPK